MRAPNGIKQGDVAGLVASARNGRVLASFFAAPCDNGRNENQRDRQSNPAPKCEWDEIAG
jgi:hypothetical protein